jgi:hypothetical protein
MAAPAVQVRCRVSCGNAYSREWIPSSSAIVGTTVDLGDGSTWRVEEVTGESRISLAGSIPWHESEGAWTADVDRYQLLVYYKYRADGDNEWRWLVKWRDDDDGGHYEDGGSARNPMEAREMAARAVIEESQRESMSSATPYYSGTQK